MLTKEDLTNLDYHAVRGEEGVKEASLKIGDMTVNVAVAHSMVLAKPLLEEIKNGTSKYHFIEIMGCPGGCAFSLFGSPRNQHIIFEFVNSYGIF